MVGASFVRLDNGVRSILFSGDIGRPNDLVLTAPSKMDGADYLVVESTYGDRAHKNADVLAELAEVINRTAARGGVGLIPAFAVGRAQSLMYSFTCSSRATRSPICRFTSTARWRQAPRASMPATRVSCGWIRRNARPW